MANSANIAACQWCQREVTTDTTGRVPSRCPGCGMTIRLSVTTTQASGPTQDGKTPRRRPGAAAKSRASAPRRRALATEPVGQPVLGIDPGARYTGIVLRDGDTVLHATTLVRPDNLQEGSPEWLLTVVERVRAILATCPPGTRVGIEGIAAPKGFARGKQAAINPAPLVHAAAIYGAVLATIPDAVVVPPGGNGSQHLTHYPSVLQGRRPADLSGDSTGAGTRDHEQSAYDVAGKAAKVHYPRPPLRLAGLR